ncbi:MAG: glycosyltransferase [Chloroflexota bacterium]
MACGVPVVAVNRFGPGEIVTDGETGWLVEPADLDGLAAALAEAIDDPIERARRGHRAQEVATERYGWFALARQVADVLDAAVTDEPGSNGAPTTRPRGRDPRALRMGAADDHDAPAPS